MNLYSNAIAKKPGHSIEKGIGSAPLRLPHYQKALDQHNQYIEALKRCGLQVEVLKEDEAYPDSTFVEDPAIVTKRVAVINRLGAYSRQGEEKAIKECLKRYYNDLEEIRPPGALEGGDIMQVDDLFFIGLSSRTNREGALQLQSILSTYGYRSNIINSLPPDVLHLKSGIAYLGDNNLLMTRDFCREEFVKDFNIMIVPNREKYAANSLRVNDYVLVPEGYEETRKIVEKKFPVITVDTSEFRKLDGGLSCLSLRF